MVNLSSTIKTNIVRRWVNISQENVARLKKKNEVICCVVNNVDSTLSFDVSDGTGSLLENKNPTSFAL